MPLPDIPDDQYNEWQAAKFAQTASLRVASIGRPPAYIDSSSHQAFINGLLPLAQEWEGRTGIDAGTWLAMAASESNWGKAGTALFGIKGSGNAGSLNSPTWESVNGQRVNQNDNFATYKTAEDAFQGFWDLMQNPRYSSALKVLQNGGNGDAFVHEINSAGYATDPNWASSVRSIATTSIAPLIAQATPMGAQAPYPQGLNTTPGIGANVAPASGVSPQFPAQTPPAASTGFQPLSAVANAVSGVVKPLSDAVQEIPFEQFAQNLMSTLGASPTPSGGGAEPQRATTLSDQSASPGQQDFGSYATGKIASLGYNDMAGVDTTPSPAFGANSQDAMSPIDVARSQPPPPSAASSDTFGATPPPLGYNDMAGVDTSPAPAFGANPPNAPSPIDAASGYTPSPQAMPYNDMAGAPSGLHQPSFLENALSTVSKAAERPQQAISAAIMPDLSHPNETPQQRTQRYWSEHTDPNASTIDRLGQLLDYATSIEDTQVAETVKANPNAAWIGPAYKLATNPLTYGGVTRPMMIGGGIGAGVGAGASAVQGGSPSDIATGAISGYGTGQLVGGGAEGLYQLGKGGLSLASKVAPYVPGAVDAAGRGLTRLGEVGTERGLVPGLGIADANGLSGYRTTGDIGPVIRTPRDSIEARAQKNGATVMYHGTGGDFARPLADKFDPNGLVGPGYYLTDDPRVSGGLVSDTGEIVNPGYAQNQSAKVQQDASFRQQMIDAHQQAIDRANGIMASPSWRDHPTEGAWARQVLQERPAEIERLRRADEIGPNVRAVNVPNTMKLFVADGPAPPGLEDSLAKLIESSSGPVSNASDRFLEGIPDDTGWGLYRGLVHAGEGDKEWANAQLEKLGYDGIQYAGGKRVPLRDATGTPIEHNVVMVFPNEQSLGKLTNAISGTRFGSSPTIGGALVGGYAGSQQGDTPEERARNAALGAVSGAVGGHLLGRLGAGKNVDVGLSIKADTPAPGMVRMYRGEPNLANRATVSETSRVGRWFTPDLNEAHQYGRDTYGDMSKVFAVDVPAREVEQYRVKTSTGEVGYNLPPQYAGQAAEVPPPTAGSPTTNGVPSEPGRAGNILLKKYVPEEIRQVITDTFDANPGMMEETRRGVVSDAAVRELADAAGTTVDKIVKRWQPGDAQNAESILAMRQALAAKSQEVLDAQKAAQATNSTQNLLTFQLRLREQQDIQHAVSGVTAEAGRALRQFRQEVTGATQSGDAQRMEALLRKLGGREWTQELAGRLAQIDPNDPTAMYKFMRDATPNKSTWLNDLWYNALLSAPQTHLSNAISNTVSAILSPVERTVAAGVEVPLAALQGRARGRFFGEVMPDAFGMIQGFPEGVQKALYVLKNGFSLDSAVRMDIRRTQAIKGPLGDVVNMPSRALAAADVMGQSVMVSGAKNALAYRIASSEGLKGKAFADRIAYLSANPTPAMLKDAGLLAEYRLFRQEPGKWTSNLMRLRESSPGGVMRFVLPFIQTPVNLTKFGAERSPLGWFNPALRRNLASQDPAAADNIARALMGTMAAAGIAALFGQGQITGAAPTNPAERDAFYRAGKQPNSFHVGDQWVSWQKMEPFTQDFAMIAGVVDAVRDAKAGTSPTEMAAKIGTTMAQGLVSQTYLSGLSDVMNAITDPERYGAQFLERSAASFLPFSSLGRTVVNATDPTIRQPKGIIDAVKQGIPGLSGQVPSKLNAFGEETQREGSPFSPYRVTSAKVSQTESELARLRVEPGFAGKSTHGIDLTPAEQRQYQIDSGKAIKFILDDYISSPEYKQDTDPERVKTIQSLIQQARDDAGYSILDTLSDAEYDRRKAAQLTAAGR